MENLVIEAHLVDCDQAWKEERGELTGNKQNRSGC